MGPSYVVFFFLNQELGKWNFCELPAWQILRNDWAVPGYFEKRPPQARPKVAARRATLRMKVRRKVESARQ
jgi:hypothetical protein